MSRRTPRSSAHNEHSDALAVTSLDGEALVLRAADDVVLDVLLDDRRIWSFWSLRDTAPGDGADERVVAWPGPMAKFLDGHTRITVRAHVDGTVLLNEERAFGSSAERISVVNAHGVGLSIDNSGRMQATFDTRSPAQVAPLLDSVEIVLEALGRAGVEAFPAYGTLLGAVRDAALIGHDSDADLGYVSRHPHPVDVIRESFELQRALARAGFEVVRYSGAGFKVVVRESDGHSRGLDVFGGFLADGLLVLLGEVRAPFEREWIFPLGTTVLEGRELPAPAAPEHLLSAMYGPGWATPDPAFKFETPASTTRRLDDWFRGLVVKRSDWDRRYQAARFVRPSARPSALVRLVRRRESEAALVVDLGCGRGTDARWLARRGLSVLGLDFSPRGFEYVDQRRGDLDLELANMNVLELRHALSYGARVGAVSGRSAVFARHLVDTLPGAGRENLWRFLALACTGGGRSYLDFLVAADPEDPWARRALVRPLDADQIEREIVAHGGRVVRRTRLGSKRMGLNRRNDAFAGRRRACRMVVEWT